MKAETVIRIDSLPISIDCINKMKGTLLESSVPLDSVVIIGGREFKVVECKEIEILLYVKTGILSIKKDYNYTQITLETDTKLKSLGFNSKKDFIKYFFKAPDMLGITTVKKAYFVSFQLGYSI